MNNKEIIENFVDRVRRFASVHDLFVKGGKYIVALSGGADSVAMLLVMRLIAQELDLEVDAAHCNFHLRGDESMRDELFCKELCQRLGVPFHVVHFDTQAYADLHHVSIEMAARDLRYAYFENLRQDIAAIDICVAHHRDDSVETVLLNLVRGTGLRGLRGIQPRNAHIIRPLLTVSRQDILQFLSAQGESYVTDSTNLHNDVKRNKIRLDIMPLLRELNPSVAQSIFDSSLRVGEALKVFDAAMARSIGEVVDCGGDGVDGVGKAEGIGKTEGGFSVDADRFSIDIKKLLAQPSPEYTLHELLSACGFSSAQVEQVFVSLHRCPTGKLFASESHELVFDRGEIVVQKKQSVAELRPMRIPETGTYVYGGGIRLKVGVVEWGEDSQPSRQPHHVCLDASQVSFPLTVRPVEQGDRFVPFGMEGMKLVSDYLTDRKKNLFEKRSQLVVTDAKGRICWLVGERADNRFRVTPATKSAVSLAVV